MKNTIPIILFVVFVAYIWKTGEDDLKSAPKYVEENPKSSVFELKQLSLDRQQTFYINLVLGTGSGGSEINDKYMFYVGENGHYRLVEAPVENVTIIESNSTPKAYCRDSSGVREKYKHQDFDSCTNGVLIKWSLEVPKGSIRSDVDLDIKDLVN